MYSSLWNDHYLDLVEIYTEDALEHGAHLTRGGLLLIALMSRGDYDVGFKCILLIANINLKQDGIRGCGIDIARKLACYGLGDALLEAATTLPLVEFVTTFCVKWHNEVCQTLILDPLGILQRKHRELALTIQMMTDFPSPFIIASYLAPLTSWSNDQPRFGGIVSSRHPDIATITRFCNQHFSWSVETLLDKMCGVWTAIVIQSFCQVSNHLLRVTCPSADGSYKLPRWTISVKFALSDLRIINSHLKSTPTSPLFVYTVTIPSAPLYAATTASISAQDPIKHLIAA